ncbi:hypothetical protein ACMZ6Y_02200 [Streptococcus pluranimalium]|uniref:hypothetical protein n=1 Tax=Streptococcus hyovaginalis TaxID=149015 RepID=UPI001478B690
MILNNIDFTIIIDWILRIVQIATFIGVIIKVSFKGSGYVNNVEIQSIIPLQFDRLHDRFHFIREFNHTSNEDSTNHFLFYPKDVDIKKIEFLSLSFENKLVETKLDTVEELKNNTCLIIHTSLPGTIPNLRIRWETSLGEIGEYTFTLNGYNGNTNISSYKYKLTTKRKLMLVLGL